jgi:biotin transport system substrate-specific component
LSNRQTKKNSRAEIKTAVSVTFPAIFAAVMAVSSYISIPTPFGINLTLQTFAVALCGYILGTRLGALSVGVWLLVGLCGLPVFTNGGGGFSAFVGPTAGFIYGFAALCAMSGLGKMLAKSKKLDKLRPLKAVIAIALGVLGLGICHALGVYVFHVVRDISVAKAFALVSSTFLPKDVISVALAYFVSLPIVKGLNTISEFKQIG